MAATNSTGPATFSGPRAIVQIIKDGQPVDVGIFNSVNYSIGISIVPVETLGSLLPRELVQTGQDPVQLTCSGFRVLNAGPYGGGLVPTVEDLLRYDGITLTVLDRQTSTGSQRKTKPIMVVKGAKCTGYRTTHNAKGLADLEVTYMGIVATDESADDSAMTDATSVSYPLPGVSQ